MFTEPLEINRNNLLYTNHWYYAGEEAFCYDFMFVEIV